MKKIIALIITLVIVFTNTISVFAQSLPPTPPPIPTAPSMPTPIQSGPTAPPAPTAPPIFVPTAPPLQTAPPAPTAPPIATVAPTIKPTKTPTSTPTLVAEPTPASTSASLGGPTPAANQEVLGQTTGGQESDGGMGSNSIDTGDATTDGIIVTDLNSNLASLGEGLSNGGSAAIVNSGNGSDSTNSGSAVIVNNNDTTQTNSANIVNGLYQSAVTGDNSASKNTGGDSTITTGDANVTGTIITSVNTNVAGVAVAEFNVLEDTTGDIVLDFGNICISNCGSVRDAVVKNTGNGADSTNNSSLDVTNNNTLNQLNDVILVNNMDLFADSGNNDANKNTGGNSNVTTGDANVAANLLTFANNNLSGNLVYAVVNIFGDLIGDIIFPEGLFNSCCGASDVTLTNTDNGAGSTNTTNYSNEITDSTTQINNLEIENNLIFDANSGGNETVGNTGGNSSIVTGDTSVDARVLNIANNNIAGGNMWLVIVNEAGRWIGRIMGAPDSSNFGGSSEFEFMVDQNGGVTVANAGNGAGSTNNAILSETTNNTTNQINNAKIVNNVNLEANSGDNSASKNTNGNSSIVTGDANIVANIVNFVNNNITGGGKMFVTIVNVFGSWLGNFLGPDYQPEVAGPSEVAVGGADVSLPNSSQDNSNNNNNNSQSTPSISSSNSTQIAGVVAPTVLQRSGARVLGSKISLNLPETVGSAVDVAQKKVVNINLAWALAILFPIGLISMIFRRRLAIKKILTSFLVLLLLVSSIRPFVQTVFAEEIIISGNGSGSTSEAVVNVTNTTSVTQTNNAQITNEVNPTANTGENTASNNTGGSTAIVTGDTTTNVEVTNLINNSVVETPCCETNDTTISISGNGADSDSSVTFNLNNSNNINVTQTANIVNNVTGSANTGNNSANNNIGSNVTIDTGNIKVTGGIKNQANNYFVKSAVGNGGFLASISNNGKDTENKINANLGETSNININNNYIAYNFVDWDLNTGGNSANGNLRGNVFIKTGNIFFDFLIANAANIGGVDVDCCGADDPNDPDDRDDPDDPDDPSDPNNPPVNGGGNNNGGPSSNSSVGGSSTASTGPQILGLSATSSK